MTQLSMYGEATFRVASRRELRRKLMYRVAIDESVRFGNIQVERVTNGRFRVVNCDSFRECYVPEKREVTFSVDLVDVVMNSLDIS